MLCNITIVYTNLACMCFRIMLLLLSQEVHQLVCDFLVLPPAVVSNERSEKLKVELECESQHWWAVNRKMETHSCFTLEYQIHSEFLA